MESVIKETDLIHTKVMNKGFPIIHKKGIVSKAGEMSPFVFRGRLYRVESISQDGCTNPQEERKHSFARIRDVEKDVILSEFAAGHYFFSGFADNDKVYVLGTLNNAHDGWMGGDTVKVFESTDLVNWSERVLFRREGWIFYNHAVVKTEDGYVITVEIKEPSEIAGEKPFTQLFARSKDMIDVEFLDFRCAYPPDRYIGGCCMHYFNKWYYLSGLTVLPGSIYVTYITRTKDFINWEIGKYNPFLFITNEDRCVSEDASSEITDEMREIIKTGYFCSASDPDYCEFKGKTVINYIVGNQRGLGFMAEAIYDGPLSEMLENFFD